MIARTLLVTTFTTALVVAACAPAAPRQVAPSRTTAQPASTLDDAGAGTLSNGEEVPSLDILAARGATDAPLMREALRVPDAVTKPSELRAVSADGCFRALVAANVPVRAWFEDDAHAPRGEIAGAATRDLVPPRGPACARKGETLRLLVESPIGARTIARAIVWQAP